MTMNAINLNIFKSFIEAGIPERVVGKRIRDIPIADKSDLIDFFSNTDRLSYLFKQGYFFLIYGDDPASCMDVSYFLARASLLFRRPTLCKNSFVISLEDRDVILSVETFIVILYESISLDMGKFLFSRFDSSLSTVICGHMAKDFKEFTGLMNPFLEKVISSRCVKIQVNRDKCSLVVLE